MSYRVPLKIRIIREEGAANAGAGLGIDSLAGGVNTSSSLRQRRIGAARTVLIEDSRCCADVPPDTVQRFRQSIAKLLRQRVGADQKSSRTKATGARSRRQFIFQVGPGTPLGQGARTTD